jgi:hypothetical protein
MAATTRPDRPWQYITRAPLSLQKLTYDRSGGKVLYHTSYNPYFKQNASLWSAPDFIAHLTQFIHPWGMRSAPASALATSPNQQHRCLRIDCSITSLT